MLASRQPRMVAKPDVAMAPAAAIVALCVLVGLPGKASAGDDGGGAPPTDQTFAVHAQSTLIDQAVTDFRSPYVGKNSLTPSQGRETFTATLYAGFRPWRGGEIWIDPEIDQGFGLDDTEGVAGFPNGQGAKVGKVVPYFRLQRIFFRQTIDLGGERQKVDAGQNQLGGSQTVNRLVFWVGKLSVVDIFDTNKYAHDAANDFLNFSLIDAGSFDYAADAWGYTYGAAVEWYQGRWTLRGGAFDLSSVPNGAVLDPTFGQDQYVGEIEERHTIGGQEGRLIVTSFLTRGRIGDFADAIRLAETTGQTPDTALVRRYRSRAGISIDLEQSVTDDLGLFARAGVADGHVEPYEYADIDQTVSGGLSLSGKRWGRGDDTVGFAGVVNSISKIHQQYLADGGLGILVGDGKLPHPGPEEIIETYYKIAVTANTALTFDAQLVGNPAYNRDRGPAPIFAARLHAQF
ncbi:MAG TPA: carbohydrate porin [Caulobacteraceae bacterium]|nr:carbohydrate porin [Caulobacteraceae bacterium]